MRSGRGAECSRRLTYGDRSRDRLNCYQLSPNSAVLVPRHGVAHFCTGGQSNALIVASPRPTTDLVQLIQVATGSGFPSAHAFSATLLYGAFWIVLPTIVPNQTACRLLRWTTVLVAVGICWSRIQLGAH